MKQIPPIINTLHIIRAILSCITINSSEYIYYITCDYYGLCNISSVLLRTLLWFSVQDYKVSLSSCNFSSTSRGIACVESK